MRGSGDGTEAATGAGPRTRMAISDAVTLHRAGKLEAAAAAYRGVLAEAPKDAATWANLGIALNQLGRLTEAEAACRQSLVIDPAQMNGGNNLGIVVAAQGRHDEAVGILRRVVGRFPDFHEAWLNLGLSLSALGEIGEATAAFARAHMLAPNYIEALVQLVYHKLSSCDWEGLDHEIARLSQAVRDDAGEVNPFVLLPICRDPAEILRAARQYAARVQRVAGAQTDGMAPVHQAHAGGKLRLAYASADFHQHATAVLAAELFELHDRQRFEVTAYSFGPHTDDAMRVRLKAAFDRFVDVSGQSTNEIVETIRRDRIDILVDLKGYTRGARTAILARRPAPVQVNYLGYPGTLGASFIDYIIADATVIPPGAEKHYRERVVRLPGCYQCNDARRPMPVQVPTRAAVGLPEQGTVFCCFNQPYKITPDVFAVWMQLLRESPGSVLWLLEFNQEATGRLRALAQRAGIDPSRLIFAPKLPTQAHLARFALADLFLDTSPCAAHTTASDALWAGVPVLTLAGSAFQSRVAASLLVALGLPDLVTTTLADYRALAARLGSHRDELEALKRRVAAARTGSDVFSGAAIARKLERAYDAIWARHRAGLAPDHLEIGAM